MGIEENITIGSRVLKGEELKLLLPQYGKIFNEVLKIRSIAKDCKSEKSDGYKNGDKLNRHHENVISILGARGSGKTSVLLTVKHIIECSKKEFSICKNDKNGEYDVEGYDKLVNDILLDIFVPENIDNKEIMGWIIGAFKEVVDAAEKKICMMPSCKKRLIWKDFDCCLSNTKNPVTEKYKELIRVYEYTREGYKKIQESNYVGDSDYIQKSVEILNAEVIVMKRFKSFIDELVHLYSQESGCSPLIHIFFDDIDLMPRKAIEILNSILKYLSLENIVVYVGADYNNFKEAVSIASLERDGLLNRELMECSILDDNKTIKFIKSDLANDFLNKAMPSSLRFELQEYDNEKKKRFTYGNPDSKECSEVDEGQLYNKDFILDDLLRNIIKEKYLKSVYDVMDGTPRCLINIYKIIKDEVARDENKKEKNDKEKEKKDESGKKDSHIKIDHRKLISLILDMSKKTNHLKNELLSEIIKFSCNENQVVEMIDCGHLIRMKQKIDEEYYIKVKERKEQIDSSSNEIRMNQLKDEYCKELEVVADAYAFARAVQIGPEFDKKGEGDGDDQTVNQLDWEGSKEDYEVFSNIFQNNLFGEESFNPFFRYDRRYGLDYDVLRFYNELKEHIGFKGMLFMNADEDVQKYMKLLDAVVKDNSYNQIAKIDNMWIRKYIRKIIYKFIDLEEISNKSEDMVRFRYDKDSKDFKIKSIEHAINNIISILENNNENNHKGLKNLLCGLHIFEVDNLKSGEEIEGDENCGIDNKSKSIKDYKYMADTLIKCILGGEIRDIEVVRGGLVYMQMLEYIVDMRNRINNSDEDKQNMKKEAMDKLESYYKSIYEDKPDISNIKEKSIEGFIEFIMDEKREAFWRRQKNRRQIFEVEEMEEKIKENEKSKNDQSKMKLKEIDSILKSYKNKEMEILLDLDKFKDISDFLGHEDVVKFENARVFFENVDKLYEEMKLLDSNLSSINRIIFLKEIDYEEYSVKSAYNYVRKLQNLYEEVYSKYHNAMIELDESQKKELETIMPLSSKYIMKIQSYEMFKSYYVRLMNHMRARDTNKINIKKYEDISADIDTIQNNMNDLIVGLETIKENVLDEYQNIKLKNHMKDAMMKLDITNLANEFEKHLEKEGNGMYLHSEYLDFIEEREENDMSTMTQESYIQAVMLSDMVIGMIESLDEKINSYKNKSDEKIDKDEKKKDENNGEAKNLREILNSIFIKDTSGPKSYLQKTIKNLYKDDVKYKGAIS